MSEIQPLESYPADGAGADPTRKKPSSGTVIAAILGAMALIFGSLALVRAATSPGGATSPEEAVRNLLDATANEDVIGVLQSLEPGERDSFRGPIEDIADELERMGVLAEGFDLQGISGIGLDFTDVALSSSELADGFAAVSIDGGTFNAAVIPEDLPLGPFFDSFFEEMGGEDPRDAEPTEESTSLEDVPFEIVTVERDGGWYVSLWYSVAEAARQDAGLELPAFGRGLVPDGADSPEAAVRELVDAGVALDIRTIFTLLPPGEASALHDYAPLFLEDAEAEIAEMIEEEEVEIDVTELELSTEGGDGSARVGIEAFALDASFADGTINARYAGNTFSGEFAGEDESMSFEYDGECFRQEGESFGDPVDEEMCRGDEDFPPVPDDLASLVPAVTAVEVDGQWYVSPTRTVLDSIVQVLRPIDQDDLEGFVDSFFGMFFFPFGGFGAGESFDSVEGELEFEEDFEFEDDFDSSQGGFEQFEDGSTATTFVPGDGEFVPTPEEQACFDAMNRQAKPGEPVTEFPPECEGVFGN